MAQYRLPYSIPYMLGENHGEKINVNPLYLQQQQLLAASHMTKDSISRQFVSFPARTLIPVSPRSADQPQVMTATADPNPEQEEQSRGVNRNPLIPLIPTESATSEKSMSPPMDHLDSQDQREINSTSPVSDLDDPKDHDLSHQGDPDGGNPDEVDADSVMDPEDDIDIETVDHPGYNGLQNIPGGMGSGMNDVFPGEFR